MYVNHVPSHLLPFCTLTDSNPFAFYSATLKTSHLSAQSQNCSSHLSLLCSELRMEPRILYHWATSVNRHMEATTVALVSQKRVSSVIWQRGWKPYVEI